MKDWSAADRTEFEKANGKAEYGKVCGNFHKSIYPRNGSSRFISRD